MNKIIKKKRLILIPLGLILLWFVFIIYSEYRQETKQPPEFKGASDFTTATNAERSKRNLVILEDSTELSAIAERKCKDMATRQYQAHQDPDGKYIWDYAPKGFKYGENLAGSYYSSNEVMQSWINSPTHLENIVDPMFKEIGHAVCTDGKQYLVVQVFKS